MATGQIKKYQLIVASINLLNLPVSWVVLKFFPNPYLTVYIMIVLSIIAFVTRLFLVSEMIGLSKKQFLKQTISRVFVVALIIGCVLGIIYTNLASSVSLLLLLVRIFLSFLFVVGVILIIGITPNERRNIMQIIRTRLSHI